MAVPILRRAALSLGAVYTLTNNPSYEKPQLKGPFPVVLGGGWPNPSAPIYPMVPDGNPSLLQGIKSYDSKYPNKAKVFITLPVSGTAYSQPVNDSVTPSDALTFDVGLNLADNPTLADSLAFDVGMNIADNPAIADALAMDRGMQIDEALTLADNATTGLSSPPVAPLTRPRDYLSPQLNGPYPVLLGGLNTTNPAWFIDDSVTTSDALAKDVGMVLADTLSLADDVSTSGGSVAANPLVFLTRPKDYLASQLNGPFPMLLGGMNVGVVTGVNFGQAFADSVSVDDTAYIDRQPNVDDDLVSLADSVTLAMTYQRSLGDTVTLADQIIPGGGVQASDVVFITDNIDLLLSGVVQRAQNIDDSVGVDDVITFSLGNLGTFLNPGTAGPYMDIT